MIRECEDQQRKVLALALLLPNPVSDCQLGLSRLFSLRKLHVDINRTNNLEGIK